MCAALQLMQAGFPTRISFVDLHARYSSRMPTMLSKLKPIMFCEALLVALDLHGGRDFQMGLTKVFFRPGKLAFMDELTSADPENVDAIVRKVRVWLARKRFFAAGHAVRATQRVMKNVERARAFRRFRSAANVMVRVVRVWKPLLMRVRRKLYSEEVLARRALEAAARKKAEEEEKARLEAEEEARRKAEEERVRLAEEERIRKVQEEKRRQEEQRKQAEDTIARLKSEAAEQTSHSASIAAQLVATKAELEKTAEALSQKEDELAAEYDRAAAAAATAAAAAARASNEAAAAASAAEADRITAATAARVAEEERSRLDAELTAEQKRAAGLESELRVSRAEIETERGNLAAQRARAEEESAEANRRLESVTAAAAGESSDLIAEVQRIGDEKAAVEGALRDMIESRRVLQTEHDTTAATLAATESAAEAAAVDAATKLEELSKVMDAMVKQRDDEIARLNAEISSAVTELDNTKEALRLAVTDAEALARRHEELRADRSKLKQDTDNEISELRKQHAETKSELEGAVARLEAEFASEQQLAMSRAVQLDEAASEQAIAQTTIVGLQSQIESLQGKLAASDATNCGLSEELLTEKHGREDDVRARDETIVEVTSKAKLDLEIKDDVIASVKLEKRLVDEKLAAETAKASSAISSLYAGKNELESELKDMTAKHDTARAEISEMKSEVQAAIEAKDLVLRERGKLIDTAMRCQSAVVKLRK